MLESAISIATLRVRAPVGDRVALQLAIDRQLQGAELTPARLPPSALLVVRHLADPLPGRLGADPHRFRPPRAWAEAVRERLDHLLERAVRPRAGRLSPAAESVLFADAAEFTACLVLDLVRGVTQDHWWWRGIRLLFPELVLPAGEGAAGLDPSLLLRLAARELPAVFACLGEWQAAAELAAALDQRRTRELLEVLAAAHDVDPRVIGRPRSRQRTPGSGPTGAEANGCMATAETGPEPQLAVYPSASGVPVAMPNEPWRPWLPAAVGERPLSPDQRCLIGVALALHRAPTAVRQARFVRQAETWWGHPERSGRLSRWRDELHAPAGAERAPRAGPAVDSRADVPGFADPETGTVAGDRPAPAGRIHRLAVTDDARPGSAARSGSERGAEVAAPRHPPRGPHFTREERAPAVAAASRDTGNRGEFPAEAAGADGNRAGNPAEGAGAAPLGAGSGRGDPPPTPPGPKGNLPEQLAEPSAALFPGERFTTRLGGVLYLIHALEELEIPAAFEDPWRLESRLGPWGALALIARTLLGDRFTALAGDPLWTVLAALSPSGGRTVATAAARTGDAASDGQRRRHRRSGTARSGWPSGLPDYRAPADWPKALEEGAIRVRWTSAAGRLWLWSESGYLLASVRRDRQRPIVQARSELAARAGASKTDLSRGRIDRVPLAARPNAAAEEDLVYWAAAAAPAVARRLLLALDAGRQGVGALWRLLSVEGTLYLSASHVDLVADLDQIRLPVRRAGLDRNPGWLADYGRVVLFHFR